MREGGGEESRGGKAEGYRGGTITGGEDTGVKGRDEEFKEGFSRIWAGGSIPAGLHTQGCKMGGVPPAQVVKVGKGTSTGQQS